MDEKYSAQDIKRGRRNFIIHRLFHPLTHLAAELYSNLENKLPGHFDEDEIYELTFVKREKAKFATREYFINLAYRSRLYDEKLKAEKEEMNRHNNITQEPEW
jgi:hypothetical protein